MKQLASLFVAAAMSLSPLASGQQPDAVANALDAANRWLVLSDAGDGAASWEQAAPSFRAAVSKAAWSDALRHARQPFGALRARRVLSSEFKSSLPGAPDGEYVVIRYDTEFEHKAHALETVIPARDQDGSWKVSSYFVK